MCGIAGAFQLNSRERLEPETLVPMISILAHRGPDDWGYYLDERRRVMLLHSRLSIVDLQGGHQPLSNEDGSVWVACNGEIYDFKRIADDLRGRGHVFRSGSDTEVIVHLYEEYGEDFVEHLRGEFAFALYDRRREILYLVRDRFGIKPLFYATAGDTLLFGSEIKALFRHPSMRVEFDRDTIYHLLTGVPLPGETIFKGVRPVEPGCLLRVTKTGSEQVRYWDLDFNTLAQDEAVERELDPETAASEFRRLFEDAVALRLQGDVEVATYLSGGIDSAAVSMVMAKQSDRPIKAFTISFSDGNYDEFAPARAIAEAGGMEHHVVSVRRGALAEHFAKSLWHSEAPTINSHGTAKFLLSELASRHVKVVLTGQGADELLAGYEPFEHQLLLEAALRDPGDDAARQRLAQFRPIAGYLDVQRGVRRYPAHSRVCQLFGAYPYSAMRPLLHQARIRGLLSPELRQATTDTDSLEQLATRLDRCRMSGRSSLAATQYVLFKTDLPSHILTSLADRPEMAHSVEGRVPFLDHKLVEFACRLPLSLKINENGTKDVLRRAMRDVVPEAVRKRRKKLFLAPSAESLGLDQPRSELINTYLTPERIRDAGIFDDRALKPVLYGIRYLPKGSYYHTLLEGIGMGALSLHVLHDLFCRNLKSSAAHFADTRLDYRHLRETEIASE